MKHIFLSIKLIRSILNISTNKELTTKPTNLSTTKKCPNVPFASSLTIRPLVLRLPAPNVNWCAAKCVSNDTSAILNIIFDV